MLLVQGRRRSRCRALTLSNGILHRASPLRLVGNVRFDAQPIGFRVDPLGARGSPVLVERRLELGPTAASRDPIPSASQRRLVKGFRRKPIRPTSAFSRLSKRRLLLQSLPVFFLIYVDFDGEKGPFSLWGTFDAAPSGANNTQIKGSVAARGGGLPGLQPQHHHRPPRVLDSAPRGSRMHVLVTPTNTAAPGAGGVAFVGSFNWTSDPVCWAFYTTGKIVRKSFRGRPHPRPFARWTHHASRKATHGGHGSGETGRAPIMGVGYYQNLSQS